MKFSRPQVHCQSKSTASNVHFSWNMNACCSCSVETQPATFPILVARVLLFAMLKVIVNVICVRIFGFMFILSSDELKLSMTHHVLSQIIPQNVARRYRTGTRNKKPHNEHSVRMSWVDFCLAASFVPRHCFTSIGPLGWGRGCHGQCLKCNGKCSKCSENVLTVAENEKKGKT